MGGERAGVGGEFVPEIAHAIHEQVGAYRRRLFNFLEGDDSALDGGTWRGSRLHGGRPVLILDRVLSAQFCREGWSGATATSTRLRSGHPSWQS